LKWVNSDKNFEPQYSPQERGKVKLKAQSAVQLGVYFLAWIKPRQYTPDPLAQRSWICPLSREEANKKSLSRKSWVGKIFRRGFMVTA